MKKSFLKLSLAVLTVGLLGSCSKINERLDNLDKRVDGIENEQIATINTQITNINSSIADLGTIRSDISSLKQSAENHGIDIINLEEADRALKDRIDNLEDYLDVTLPKFAEKEWVEATFSTLEQYEATCDTIAKIDARIGALDAKLSKDIKATADSLTKWVNEQLDAYYTAAEMDAKLAQMKSAIDSAKASGGITDAKADSIARELAKTKTAVDSAKANIRKEYRAAIDTAIKTSEGKLTKALQEKISDVNGKIESLTTRVAKLETSVADLKGRVEKLEGMIQSVVIVPAYSDGSVKVEDDTLFIDLSVTPKDIVKTLDTVNFTILLNRVQTKAVALDTVPTDSIKFFKTYKENGTVSIKAHIKKFLAELGVESLTVAVNLKVTHSNNLTSDYTTEFVPVTLPVSVRLDKHSIVVPSPSSDKDTTLIATVKPSTKDVAWTSSNEGIATVNEGTVTIKAHASGKDTIVVKTVEGNATDTCFLTIIPEGFVDLGVVVDGKPLYWAEKNLGASNPEDCGYYYFWAGTTGYTHDGSKWVIAGTTTELSGGFCQSNAPYYENSAYKKYTGSDSRPVLDPADDAATVTNSSWRTPTSDEFKALAASCVWIWCDGENEKYNNTTVKGYIVYKAKNDADKGKANMNGTWKKWNGSSYSNDSATTESYSISDTHHIFLPAAGDGGDTGLDYVGDRGYYWSSSLNTDSPDRACSLYFRDDSAGTSNRYRCYGQSVRALSE